MVSVPKPKGIHFASEPAESGLEIYPSADLYCGAGGLSTAMIQAAAELGIVLDHVAVNHWDVAIATHKANHPDVEHLCESVEDVDPRFAIKGRHLRFMAAGIKCQHHSRARGGKPTTEQDRADAWQLLRWAERVDIDNILVENVREFRDWGPIYPSDHPDKQLADKPIPAEKGKYFQMFLRNLRALGYTVDHRILRASDYGDATTRERLFIQAKKGKRRRITWPAPTHVRPAELALYENSRPWRTAREIIDWNIVGESIYARKKSLVANTLRRIFSGLEKFSGLSCAVPGFMEQDFDKPLVPYLVILKGQSNTRGIDEPVPTLTGMPHLYLAEPYLVKYYLGSDAVSVDDPAPTITANYQHLALAQPYIVVLRNHRAGVSLDEPTPTLCAGGRHVALAEPCIVSLEHGGADGQDRRSYSLDRPLITVTAKADMGFVEPFLLKYHGSHKGKADGNRRTKSMDEPMAVLDTSNRFALIESFLIKYYGTGGASAVDEPVDTITTKPRFALIEAGILEKGDELAILDIRFRMLQWRELAAAHSFPAAYSFSGSQDQCVKQIGNSVPIQMAKALCREILIEEKRVSQKPRVTGRRDKVA